MTRHENALLISEVEAVDDYNNIILVWVGLVLWHINHCKLFDAKSSYFIYVQYI